MDKLIRVSASADNMLTVYSSIFVWQPFSCQQSFVLTIPYAEYQRFFLEAGKQGLIDKLFASQEAERYKGLLKSFRERGNDPSAEKLFRFYYLNDILRLSAAEIRRAYACGAQPSWLIADIGTDEEIYQDELLDYALKKLQLLSNHSGCKAKINEYKDIAYLRNVKVDSYRAYVFYIIVSMWCNDTPKFVI